MVAGSGTLGTEVATTLAAITTRTPGSGTCNTIIASRLLSLAVLADLETGGSGTATTEVSAIISITSSAPGGGGGGGSGGGTTPFTVKRGPFRGHGPTTSFTGQGL